ncbi:uncharacterized protein TrAFT101_000798 [Trichoderma asperellum]|uniref:uncharacterized protein n=1 Tax=Trichoderma asperellum TaxID=101201 RepID=UPI003326E05B|nr:hypothetical protein TrAFT101_000798 [Trichoderma asperellum]
MCLFLCLAWFCLVLQRRASPYVQKDALIPPGGRAAQLGQSIAKTSSRLTTKLVSQSSAVTTTQHAMLSAGHGSINTRVFTQPLIALRLEPPWVGVESASSRHKVSSAHPLRPKP